MGSKFVYLQNSYAVQFIFSFIHWLMVLLYELCLSILIVLVFNASVQGVPSGRGSPEHPKEARLAIEEVLI